MLQVGALSELNFKLIKLKCLDPALGRRTGPFPFDELSVFLLFPFDLFACINSFARLKSCKPFYLRCTCLIISAPCFLLFTFPYYFSPLIYFALSSTRPYIILPYLAYYSPRYHNKPSTPSPLPVSTRHTPSLTNILTIDRL